MGRASRPTAAVIDAQSNRASPQGGDSGFDAAQKVKGRKRNLVVETMGLLIALTVTAASVQDRDTAAAVVAQACAKMPRLEKLYTDGAYGGKCANDIEQAHHIRVEVVRRPGNSTTGTLHDPRTVPEQAAVVNAGFVILPKRWVVERTHAWTERWRRTVMHHDRKLDVSAAWVWLAEARMLLNRLAYQVWSRLYPVSISHEHSLISTRYCKWEDVSDVSEAAPQRAKTIRLGKDTAYLLRHFDLHYA
jgi:putative transposase